MSQLINQSVGQSTSQPVGQTVTQSVGQLLIKSVNQSVSQSVSQTVRQSVNQSTNYSVWQLVNQLDEMNRPLWKLGSCIIYAPLGRNSDWHINQHSVDIAVKILTQISSTKYRLQTAADHCFHHAIRTRQQKSYWLFSNPKNNGEQSVCSLHFALSSFGMD